MNLAWHGLPTNLVGGITTESKFDVLTLHSEPDSKCIVRLRGFRSSVFWREIPLVQRWWHVRSPRTKIINAQIAAQRVASRLSRQYDIATFEFQSSQRDGDASD